MSRSTPQKLLDHLRLMVEKYRDLRVLLEDKQEVILERDIDRLESITEQEECYVEELRGMDRDRDQWFREITGEENTSELTFDELRSYFPEESRSALKVLRHQLKQVTRDVQRLNEENMFFLNNRLTVYDRIFGMITGEEKENQTYGRDRQAQSASANQARLVDEAI